MKHIMWLWTYYYGINEHTILLTVILNNYGANNYCDWVEYKIQQKHMANWIQYVFSTTFTFYRNTYHPVYRIHNAKAEEKTKREIEKIKYKFE